MAVPEKGPQRWVVPSLGHSSSRDGAQSRFSQKERQSAFPMGRRPKGNFTKTSSYLLHQLVQPYQDSDGEGEEGEGDWESEESSVSEMPKLEEEFDGVLREETVADALHNLGRSGPGTEQVYLDLCLSGFDLADIRILSRYVHLQKLDLSKNKIEDLSCVSCMPYLLELNASQNKLTTFFDFKPPKNLKKVDFSFNQISEMCDLSAYHALTKLILDNNEIEEITGLEMCNSLTHLSLANNKISVINGLNMLPIKILCLNNNQIEKITGLENLKTLQNLDLSHNQISSLQGLENHDLLEVLDLEDNKVAQLSEIEYIENLPILRILNLLGNPIQDKTDYWLFVIFMLLQLTELDQKKIEVEEKVAAVNKYDPPPEVVAARDHLTHVVNSMMQPQRIFDSTLPSLDAPYPMLILAGPEACGKRELAHRLCRQFNTFFRYGACHTTRPPYFGEGDRVDYHFISQEVFDEMLNMGKFILTFNYGNHSYGLNRDTVEGIARDGLASCIHMEIEGVRSLKYSYFEPRYILVVPMNKEKYEGYLRRKGLFSRAEIEFAVSRVDLYIKINHKFPGYFDAVINADDLDAAYQKLSQLIREYLGLAEEPAKTLAPTAAGASSSRKTASGVPAHLVPSPRRLAKLQADGQTGEEPSGAQIHAAVPEPQDPAPAQSPAPTRGEEAPGERPASTGPADPAAPAPRRGRDASPDGKDAEARRSPRSPTPVTAEPHVPGLEAPRPEAEPAEAPPAPPAPVSPQPEPDAESAEARGALGDPPPPEPAPLGPQEVHEEETQPAQAPLPEPPRPDPAGAEARRASTPYPGPPPRQDAAAHSQQRPGGEQPAAGPPRSRRAPTRLPQPQTLAPLQSRRPTPKLLSPGGDQAPTPAREGTPGRLPPLSPPHSKPPPKPGAPAARSPRPGPGEEAGEVKLPRISPPSQDQAPDPSREGEAPPVRLPRIAPPPPPGATPGRPEAEPAAGRGAPKAPAQPRGPRKRALPTLREPAAGPARPGKAARVASRQQPERPGPPPPAAPRPGDPQPQPEKQRKGHHPRKKGAPTTAPAPEGDGGAGSTQDSDAPEAAREPSGTGSAPAGRPAQKTDPEPPEPGSSATAPAPRSRRPTGEPSSLGDLALPSRQQAEGKRVPRQGGASRERGSGPQGSAEEERGSRAGRRARGSQSTKV